MQNDEGKRPTNGDTNGDDADIYRRAGDERSVELAAAAQVVLRRSLDLVEAAMYAIPSLSGMETPSAEACCARYTWQLADTAQEIMHHSSKLADAAKDLLPILSVIGTPEAEDCSAKLQAAIDRFKKGKA